MNNVYTVCYTQDFKTIEDLKDFRPGLLFCEIGAKSMLDANIIFYRDHDPEKINRIYTKFKRKGVKR